MGTIIIIAVIAVFLGAVINTANSAAEKLGGRKAKDGVLTYIVLDNDLRTGYISADIYSGVCKVSYFCETADSQKYSVFFLIYTDDMSMYRFSKEDCIASFYNKKDADAVCRVLASTKQRLCE